MREHPLVEARGRLEQRGATSPSHSSSVVPPLTLRGDGGDPPGGPSPVPSPPGGNLKNQEKTNV
jgi:hypothetical protein